jgi:hypothetical protein
MPETLIARLVAEAATARNGSRWPAPGGHLVRRKGMLSFCEEA